MEDVRKTAQSRAVQGDSPPPVGTSFEPKRRQSKNALVKLISSLDGINVRMIAASTETPKEGRIMWSFPAHFRQSLTESPFQPGTCAFPSHNILWHK